MTLPEDRGRWERIVEEEEGVSSLRKALEADRARKSKKAKPAADDWRTTTTTPRQKTTYVSRDGSEVFDGKTWHKRDQSWWDFQIRRGTGGRLLTVGDSGGATTVEDGSKLVVRRGCLIDGNREVVHDLLAIGKWEGGPWRGGLCVVCHRWWTEAPISSKRSYEGLGRFVTGRLVEEGYLDGSGLEREVQVSPTHTEVQFFYLRDWPQKTWAQRVLNSMDPAIQEPPSRPFNYLAGKIRVADIEEAST